MTGSVSILIPTHNRAAILARTLDSLSHVRLPDGIVVECIVVANACTDNTVASVSAAAPCFPFPLRVVEESRPGLGVARNRAVREAAFDTFALLDDDITAEPDWLAGLIAARDQPDWGADIIAGRIHLCWDDVPRGRPDWLTPGMEMLLSCLDLGDKLLLLERPDIVGANFAFSRRAYDLCGPFREDLDRVGSALLGGGETYFARKALAIDLDVVYAPRMFVKHWVAPHRVQAKYLADVSKGNAISIILMKERFGPIPLARALFLGAARAFGHSLMLPLARAQRDQDAIVRHKVRAAIGAGQVRGSFMRLRNGPLH